MDQAGLEAYLTTAVHTGQQGSGQMRFTLLVGDLLTPYEEWTTGTAGLTNTFSNIDFDGGGLETGLEWVVGGDPTDPSDDAGNTPTLDNSDPNAFKFVFKRRDDAATDGTTTIVVEYGTDLLGWRNTADHGELDGVTLDDSVDLGGGFHQVTASIRKTLAPDGRLFARLTVGGLAELLFGEDFEASDGGFTLVGSPNDWAWGTPNSDNSAGTVVTTGNGGSAKCWATVLGEGGTAPYGVINPAADSILRSPDIDLTGITGAQLSFAAAYDLQTGDAAQVLIRDASNDDLLGTIDLVTPLPAASNWTALGPFALSAGDNKKIYLEFRYDGTDANYIGLYIDDVRVITP
jgi:hypothetical protein